MRPVKINAEDMIKFLRNNKGFTLLEVVVSLAIAAMTLPALLSAFSDGLKSVLLAKSNLCCSTAA